MFTIRRKIIPLLCMTLVLSGCAENDHDTTGNISSSTVSGASVSGEAVSGAAVEESPYDITPEMDASLHWLSKNQEKWSDEANVPDKYTDIAYSITDLNHNGQIEVAQFINTEFVTYSEVVPDGDSYRLVNSGKYNTEEYAMGIRCEEDGLTNEFKRDEHPDTIRPDEISPRTEAAWSLAHLVTPDALSSEQHRSPDDKHLNTQRTERIFFGSGLELVMTKKIKEEAMYTALRESLTAFLDGDRISAQICDDLMRLYKSDDYAAAAKNHENIIVTDEDNDGHPTMARISPSDKKSKDYKKEDMISVEAADGDSSRVGLAFMRYNIWKVYLENRDTIPKKSIIFGITMEGNKYLNHYFPKMMQ